ncbi:glycoside hydrolase family 97 protein [Colwellia sp. UCD-KL20]|uniref:glycoside hydrolase family 97 protein n=1 Tax=Colwellia sp. UCD-KL20 TaxID=1917165 RepID=UPI00097138DC|nr:glycoside hydrolase family 97 protein [Colwellia sp. UCD-KL20]
MKFSPKTTIKKSLAILLCTGALGACSHLSLPVDTVSNNFTLHSLDKNTQVNVFVNQAGRLAYNINFNGNHVIKDSDLGITINEIDFGESVILGQPKITRVDESYSLISKPQNIRNNYTRWTFPVEHITSGKSYDLVFRVYNDGVAYRYIVKGDETQHVNGESSSWVLANNVKTWFFERNSVWKLMSYAGVWKKANVDEMPTISSEGPIQGTPLVFELANNSGYATITKAALYNYSGMRLKAKGNRTFQANFTEGEKGFDVEGDVITPWRVTLLADDLNELVNSNVITNLNPAPDADLFKNTSYIKPGRSAWSWMSIRLGEIKDQENYVDMAKQLDFEYSIIDDGWKLWPSPWKTVNSIVERGKKQDVGVWVWVHSKDINFPAGDYVVLQDYLDKVKASGAVGVKMDFMNNEAKSSVDFEIAALRHAAKRGLLINFHGCHASTGEARTYPNELTREGIRGLEVNHHKEGHLDGAHNTALPFTRLAMGNGDYTPLYYTNPGSTTWAHQLSTVIMFQSALQIFAEDPKVLMEHPIAKKGLNILKQIPTVWDEVKVLPESKIGEFAAIAKRSGEQWFVSVLNADNARDYTIDLSFLSNNHYQMEFAEDDFNAKPIDLTQLKDPTVLREHTTTIPFQVNKTIVNKDVNYKIKLASNGGFAAVLTPVK